MKNFDINRVYRQTAPDAESTGGGGSAQPQPEATATETEQAVTAPETPAEDQGQDTIPEEVSLWEQLSKDSEDDEDILPEDSSTESSAQPESQEEPPPEAPAAEEQESTTESPAEEPTAADTAVPEPEPEEQPTSQPEPEPTPQPTAEEIAAEASQRRANLEGQLTNHFKLTEAEALQLVTNPGEVFPKLQARMFTDMWLGIEKLISQQLPNVVRNTSAEMQVQSKKVDSFFEAWPKLDRTKHGAQIAEVARVYSQVNPNATEEDVIKNVGMQVMFMNGIAPDVQSEVPPATPTPEPTPMPPHRPAAVNSAPSAPKQSSGNLYSDMAEELLIDDEG